MISEPNRSESGPIVVTSTITAVTVHLDRASVTRKASPHLSSGIHRLAFTGLPAEIEDGSLRLALAGPARVESLQSRPTFLAQHQEQTVRELELEVAAIRERSDEQQDLVAILEKAMGFLDSIQVKRERQLSSELGRTSGPGPSVDDYRATAAFLVDERVMVAGRLRGARAAIQALEPSLKAKEAALDHLRETSRLEQKDVVVEVSVEAGATIELALSYLVPGALWLPHYDVRADRERKQVEMCCYAMIQQATGEDWTDAIVTLSAAQPSVQVSPPEPAPWFLTIDEVINANSNVQQTVENAQTWNPGLNLHKQMLNRVGSHRHAHQRLLSNSEKVQAVSAAIEGRRTSTAFPLAAPVSIPCDGKPQRVILASARTSMTTSCRIVPRSSLNAYVVGSVPNTTGLPWLPGEAQVFVGGDLVGSTSLDFVAPREQAEMFFGIDETIKVERELDSRTSSRSMFSSRVRVELAYAITIENLRVVPADITVHEALPVSQDERIKAKVQSLDPRADNQERGVATWSLRLAPGQRKNIDVAYAIEYPEGLQLPQLEKLKSRLVMKK